MKKPLYLLSPDPSELTFDPFGEAKIRPSGTNTVPAGSFNQLPIA
jgi:hypothetical protein